MPDVHWGYGFAIGAVAATAVDAGGVVSPGGVGFDISCGVRLLLAPLTATDLGGRRDAMPRAGARARIDGYRVVRLRGRDRQRRVRLVPKGIALSGLQVRKTARGWRCTATVDV